MLDTATMTDYSKWKVTELKAELKTRGVPQTGLRLKQDYIDKLTALDSEATAEPAVQDARPKSSTAENEKKEDVERDQKIDEPTASQQSATESLPTEGSASPQKQNLQQDTIAARTPPTIEPKDGKIETTQVETDQQDSTERELPQTEKPEPSLPAADTQETQVQEPKIVDEPISEQVSPEIDVAESLPPAPDSSDDLRKRKRRSQSPPPSFETAKKSKISDESTQAKEDVASKDVDNQEAAHERPAPDEHRQALPTPTSDDKLNGFAGRQDPRFRELLPPTKQQAEFIQAPEQTLQDDDRQVEPALHPATPAIYIRNLMRPLQPLSLKKHLQLLATPADREPRDETLVDFFLDSIKTHCFALFDSVSTASRVRSKLHGAVWPNERDRKPLWVDFIPEDKFSDWVRTEKDSISAGQGNQRWEVTYEETDNGIEAILQEPRAAGPRTGHPPTAPASHRRQNEEQRREIQQPGPPPRQQSGGEGFKALDDRFQSTKTKPKLYYLPVARDIVDKRLAQFGTLIRKESRHHGQGGDDMRRITFEDTDMFVDGGPEYRGPRNRGGARRARGGAWRGGRRR